MTVTFWCPVPTTAVRSTDLPFPFPMLPTAPGLSSASGWRHNQALPRPLPRLLPRSLLFMRAPEPAESPFHPSAQLPQGPI